jgi:hypothetical protein
MREFNMFLSCAERFLGFGRFFLVVLFLALIVSSSSLYAQDDGPRAYWILPVGTNIIGTFVQTSQSNAISGGGNLYDPDVVTNSLAAIVSYTRSFSLFNRTALATISLPAGNASTEFDL